MKITNKLPLNSDKLNVARLKEQVMNHPIRRKVKMPKLSAWMVYGGIFVAIITVVTLGYQAPAQTSSEPVASFTQAPESTPLVVDSSSVDKLVAIDVALNIAEQTNMPVMNNVVERSVSLGVESALAQTDETAIIKPHIVQPTASSRDIVTYTVKKGDTMKSIANAYGVAEKTIRWANDMSSNNVSIGMKLKIPPVDGLLYTVKSGDTLDKLADKYGANKARIVSYNDLEITGLKNGKKIIIPGGNLPSEERPEYVAPSTNTILPTYTTTYVSGFGGNSWHIKSGTPGYPGNTYALGNCTRYAYDRRIEMGLRVGQSNWGHAAYWSGNARAEGFRVDNTPSVGAIIQGGGLNAYSHVAIVEKIKSNGDVVVSEMNAYVNGGGWNMVNGRTIPANQARSYLYIH